MCVTNKQLTNVICVVFPAVQFADQYLSLSTMLPGTESLYGLGEHKASLRLKKLVVLLYLLHMYTYFMHCNSSAMCTYTVPLRGNIVLTCNFCRVASSITYFSTILTRRNCNGNTRVVLAIIQAKTTFVGDLHHYFSSLLNTRGTQDLTNGHNS